MSGAIKIIIFVSGILFLQVGVLPHLAVFETYPNIIFISVISISILMGFKKSVVWIILSGLFLDFYSLNGVIGVLAAGLAISAYLSSFISGNIFKKGNASSIIPVFLLSITVYNLSVFLFYKVLGFGIRLDVLNFLTSIIYNTAFAVPMFYLIKKYAGKIRKI